MRSIRGALAAACAMAGVSAGRADATEVDTALLYYAEPGRVTAVETVVEGRHDFGGQRLGSFKIVYDALTGASANGAVPASMAQTFTRPSGNGSYVVRPGDTPLDDTFHDSRFAASGSLRFPLDRLTTASVGLYGSGEFDYTSLGVNASLARDLDRRNTTLSAGVSFSHDTVNPVGGRPEPLAAMALAGTPQARLAGNGAKDVFDAMAGLTQVIDRRTLVQVNYSLSSVSGYQTDPYKVVSVIAPATGEPVTQLYESRPDSRLKHILYGQLKRSMGPYIADLSYRHMTDDWGIASHTLDLHLRRDLGPDRFLEPHVRFYRQTEADFYRRWLTEGAALPEFATADYRLGAFDAWTVGLQVGLPAGRGQRLTARLERYWQSGDGSDPDAPGYLAGADLFPTVDAWIAQLGYAASF
jgi:hypothetical protein